MAKETRRVRLDPDTDLTAVLDAVRSDGVPRLVERGGEAIAVVARPESASASGVAPASKRNREQLLAMAGIWRELDADELIEAVYRRRRSAPMSPSIG